MTHNDKTKLYLEQISEGDKVYIDIGSSYETNLDLCFVENSNKTVFIEADAGKAGSWHQSPNFVVLNEKATPYNIMDLLTPHIGNKDITYLDIDIDGYDYFVLDELLKNKRPYMFIAEINEKIPPPIEFTVTYRPDYCWDGSHFFGMSISQASLLIEKYEYDLVELNANNLICIRRDKNTTGVSLSVEDAYNIGYKNPRLEGHLPEFGYNSDVDFLLDLDPQDALTEVDKFFSNYKGQYESNIS